MVVSSVSFLKFFSIYRKGIFGTSVDKQNKRTKILLSLLILTNHTKPFIIQLYKEDYFFLIYINT